MKTNSDFEQSKMLAEFLSVESADLMFVHTTDLEGNEHYDIDFRNNQPLLEGDIPCWSLAALLDVIPQEISDSEYVINITEGCDEKWVITYDHINNKNHSYYGLSTGADNLVDACYNMIVRLKKHNLI